MPVLIALLSLAVLLFILMMIIILFSGTIEGRKRPRDQDRPDAPQAAQRGPDVRKGQWPSSKEQGKTAENRNADPAGPHPQEILRKTKAVISPKHASAFDMRAVPGPEESVIQVRDAGGKATRDDKTGWDRVDEAVDESFPASDASAKY